MVHIKLDPSQSTTMPKDCFVSVRLGEVQKICRLGDSRVYRFPQNVKSKTGRIEVFHRIGVHDIHLGDSELGKRELSIDCRRSGFGSLGMKVDIEGAPRPAVEEPAGDKETKKVQAAKSYLANHDVEARLSQAMQALLRERPDDPLAFLSSKLTALRTAHPPSEKVEPQPQAGPQAQPQSMPPMKEYYPAHFQTITPEASASLYAKFPSASASAAAPPPKATSSPAPTAKETPSAAPPAAASKDLKQQCPKPGPSIGSREYYEAHCRTCTQDAFSRLYGKFPAAGQKQPSGSAATPSATAPTKAASSANNAYRLKPSVGTWLMPLGAGQAKAPSASGTKSTSEKSFKYRPSVGSWLMLNPK